MLYRIYFRHRSQFVQSLLLSTLSIVDESDDQINTEENIASDPEQICDDTANTLPFDSVTSNATMARTSDYDEAKKKQESASHSDLDSHPQHLSGMNISKHWAMRSLFGKMT